LYVCTSKARKLSTSASCGLRPIFFLTFVPVKQVNWDSQAQAKKLVKKLRLGFFKQIIPGFSTGMMGWMGNHVRCSSSSQQPNPHGAQSEQLQQRWISRGSSLYLRTLGGWQKAWGRQGWSGRNLLHFWSHMFEWFLICTHRDTPLFPPPPKKLRVVEATHQLRNWAICSEC
jgi:hypothetical protein